jgi:hypothetical protein
MCASSTDRTRSGLLGVAGRSPGSRGVGCQPRTRCSRCVSAAPVAGHAWSVVLVADDQCRRSSRSPTHRRRSPRRSFGCGSAAPARPVGVVEVFGHHPSMPHGCLGQPGAGPGRLDGGRDQAHRYFPDIAAATVRGDWSVPRLRGAGRGRPTRPVTRLGVPRAGAAGVPQVDAAPHPRGFDAAQDRPPWPP